MDVIVNIIFHMCIIPTEPTGKGVGNDTGSVISFYYAYYRWENVYTDDVVYHCNGSENSLSECVSAQHSSNCSSVAGIYCYSLPAKPECSSGDVRLVSGSGPHEGRLEVCYNENWSSVCSISADEAGMICERLGYTRSASKEYDM